MNDGTRVISRRPRAWLPAARATAAIVAMAVLALLAAACAGSPSSAGPGGSANAAGSYVRSAIDYSQCIRSHGVPDYPDPGSNGQLPKGDAQHFGVSAAQYQAAQQACLHLLPTGGSLPQQEHQCMQNSDCPPALVQQMMTADTRLARCMRSHGVPNFPDPTDDGSSGPIFNISSVGISDAASHTPRFIATLNECGRLVGANAPESFE
jgi:hypothetical protein